MQDKIPQSLLNKARLDKFRLVIETPNCLKMSESAGTRSNDLLNRDSMQMSIATLNIPAQSIPQVELGFQGQSMPVTSQTRPAYPPIRIAFNIDNNFNNYWFIFKWLNVLNNTRDSGVDPYFAKHTVDDKVTLRKDSNITYKEIKAVNKFSDYQTNITVFGLRDYNEDIVKFNFYNAFPVSLGEIQYDYKNTEEISSYFEFSYGQKDVVLIDPV